MQGNQISETRSKLSHITQWQIETEPQTLALMAVLSAREKLGD